MHLATLTTSLLGLAGLTSAHFMLNWPVGLGFDDSIEATAPCGGFDVTFNDTDTTNVTVGGFAVAVRSTHPEANWLYRATLDTTAQGNWTNLLPVVFEVGLGDFCLTDVQIPDEWAGQQGVIQVLQDAADGVLYQCAAVNFVSGVNTTVGAGCTNATGLTALVTTNTTFDNATIAGESASASSSIASSTASLASSATAASASASATKASTAAALRGGGLVGGSVLALAVFFAVCLL